MLSCASEVPVRFVPGVGPRIGELLGQKGIQTALDLVHFFPYKYLDRRRLDRIASLKVGQGTVVGRVAASGIVFLGKKRRIFEVSLTDETGAVACKWFHFYPQMKERLQKGVVLMVTGPVTLYRGEPQFVHPEIQVLDPDLMDEIRAPGIVPTYSQVPGIGQKTLRKIVRNCLERFDFTEPLTEEIRARYSLPTKREALQTLHFPKEGESLEELNSGRTDAHRREIFEELFLIQLGLAVKRCGVKQEPGIAFSWEREEVRGILAKLPFELTRAQRRVLGEILIDMRGPQPMNRLLQGDVGCGKTVVSLVSALVAIKNGYQTALMVPTEILAEQHEETAKRLLAPFKIPIVRLTGSLPAREKLKCLSHIRRGNYSLVIGTHALISSPVEFKNLGLAIIDEQHRFGVLQRAALTRREARLPDTLVMTATPIPRTLAMTLYGDLDLSIIDEMPPGRRKIVTEVIESRNRSYLHQSIREALDRGEQVFVVYPLVEESEKLALKDATRMCGELRKLFPGNQVALVHGRISAEERERIFERLKMCEIDLLVATTVVEVGIDLPNATLMVIEHADRFGLSQLHQLRGRVGRADRPSRCLLVSDYRKSEAAFRRLKVMCETNDGFRIAEEDLKIRGPGEFLGTRQSGLPELKVADLVRDQQILNDARAEAFKIVQGEDDLGHFPHLKMELQRRLGEKMKLAAVG